MQINYGDIVLVNLDPTRGSEIKKTRPCLVVSRDFLVNHTPFVWVIPIKTKNNRHFSLHRVLNPSAQNGLHGSSIVLPEQLRSLDKTRIIHKLGTIEACELDVVMERVLFLLNQKDRF